MVYRTVTRERRVTPAPEIQVRVGAPVPREVELSAFTDETYVDVPVLKRYKNDEVTQATELSPLCRRLAADFDA